MGWAPAPGCVPEQAAPIATSEIISKPQEVRPGHAVLLEASDCEHVLVLLKSSSEVHNSPFARSPQFWGMLEPMRRYVAKAGQKPQLLRYSGTYTVVVPKGTERVTYPRGYASTELTILPSVQRLSYSNLLYLVHCVRNPSDPADWNPYAIRGERR